MKYFPAMCVDNFYENPDSIREFALSQPFYKAEDGAWPGKRTKELHEIDSKFFHDFCAKVFSIYYDFAFADIEWTISTNFQLIEPLSFDKNSLKNHGWIHVDESTVFAGIIYLNPTIDINCGTSLFKVIDEEKMKNNQTTAKSNYYKYGIDKNYESDILDHNQNFIETMRFNNIYNRLISFDGQTYHGANNFFTDKEPRLTQVFFVRSIKSKSKPPLQRFIREQNVT
jgi:hypothetical protein